MEIFRKNTCITTRILRGRTYYLESSQVVLASIIVNWSPTSNTQETIALSYSITELAYSADKPSSQLDKTWLWHTLLGHVSPHHLNQLNLDFIPDLKDFWCTVCDFTKLIQNISTELLKLKTVSLKRIHTDIWGQYRVPSLGGN